LLHGGAQGPFPERNRQTVSQAIEAAARDPGGQEGSVFAKHTTEGYTDPLPGIRQKTLAFGERTLMTEFLLAKGSALPNHSHPHEQTGYLVSGHLVLKIGETEQTVRAGDAWCIPANATHGASILEDSVAIEVFSPVREDYLPKAHQGG
jgi:quercetin dioxygenase-like cupin family protein